MPCTAVVSFEDSMNGAVYPAWWLKPSVIKRFADLLNGVAGVGNPFL
jgi:hypothetical protein